MLYAAMVSIATSKGFGRHFTELSLENYAQANKFEIIGQTMMLISIPFAKAAVAFLLMRIFVKKWQRGVMWAMMTVCTFIGLLNAIVYWVQCIPISHVYNPTIPAKCWISPTQYANTALATSGEYEF
jgi:hypothetical protein